MTTMMKDAGRISVREAAQKLADYNLEVSPELTGIYLFPSDDTVRLVLLDPVTLPSEEMTPYYFGAFPKGDVEFPSAIVLIRPEEAEHIPTPPSWGSWSDAVKLWPKE